MKIEIELEEVERLKRTIEKREQEIREQRIKLEKLDEDYLVSQAKRLSVHLFDLYVKAIFEKLGFTVPGSATNLSNFMFRLRTKESDWWNRDDLELTVETEVRKNFREAFLRIGILPKEDLERMKKNKVFSLDQEFDLPDDGDFGSAQSP